MKDSKKEKSIDNWKTRVIIISIILSLWGLSWILLRSNFCSYETRGQFGDMFGAVNALFSGFAFAGIIYTILLQREELTQQRHELELTRKEFEQQNYTLRLQRFETTFFQLLKFQSDIIQNIRYSGSGSYAEGRTAFKAVYEILDARIKDAKRNVFHRDRSDNSKELDKIQLDSNKVKELYDNLYGSIQSDFGHYFNSLFELLNFIDKATGIKDKRSYARIVRAQLSENEKILLYYHGLSFEGKYAFNPLIIEYGLLYNIKQNLPHFAYPRGTYDGKAFVN